MTIGRTIVSVLFLLIPVRECEKAFFSYLCVHIEKGRKIYPSFGGLCQFRFWFC